MNNELKVKIIDSREGVSDTKPPFGVFYSGIKLGGTTRKPCEHGIEVCADCIESWSWDYWLDITPGIISTFIKRYGKFPYKIIDDPECHTRISDRLYAQLKFEGKLEE